MATRRSATDGGFTLIELFVVMALLSLVLGMFGNALFAMERSSAEQERLGNATDELRIAFVELERQVRAAYWIDPAVAGDLIKLYTADAAGTPRCVGWKVDNQQLWRSDGPGGAWRVVGTGDPSASDSGPLIVNASLSVPAFTPGAPVRVSNEGNPRSPYFVPASIVIDFRVDEGDATPARFVSTLTARNVPRRGAASIGVIPC